MSITQKIPIWPWRLSVKVNVCAYFNQDIYLIYAKNIRETPHKCIQNPLHTTANILEGPHMQKRQSYVDNALKKRCKDLKFTDMQAKATHILHSQKYHYSSRVLNDLFSPLISLPRTSLKELTHATKAIKQTGIALQNCRYQPHKYGTFMQLSQYKDVN